MANDVYGEAGKNLFPIPNTVGQFSTTVNKKTGVTQLYIQRPFLTQQSVGTYNPSTGKFTPDANSSLSQKEISTISKTEGINAIKNAAVQTATKGGATNAQKLISPNSSSPDTPPSRSNPNVGSGASVTTSDIEKELEKGYREGTRISKDGLAYGNVKYPLKLALENQDCIKFSIVEYKPSGLTPNSSLAGSRVVQLNEDKRKKPGLKGRKILGTITLPIPAGINDRNPVNWGEEPLGEIGKFFAGISLSAIVGGGQGGVNAAQQGLSGIAPDGNTSALQTQLTAKFAEAATGTSGLLARQYGAVANPNLELLFTGPSLRSFTFNFRFTPRESKEAEAVRKIIRFFKQAMSVKRSKSSLLLRAPHTFAISYLSKNKDHPYLNRFKECALTDCAVNYTPDGTYMTYTDSSMTAYELSLTFQELEPIFDDEYYEIDKNRDTSIGL